MGIRVAGWDEINLTDTNLKLALSAAGPPLPDHCNPVFFKTAIRSDNHEVFHLGLGDEHPVKRVSVTPGQLLQPAAVRDLVMTVADRQLQLKLHFNENRNHVGVSKKGGARSAPRRSR